MVRTHFIPTAHAVRRFLPTLGLTASLLAATLGLPAPTGAVEPSADPYARLEVVLKSVTIHDDNEGLLSGIGEMQLNAGIWRCNEGIPPPCESTTYFRRNMARDLPRSVAGTGVAIARTGALFDASTGETVTLDRPIPGPGDVTWSADTSPALGFAVSGAQAHVLQIAIVEWDGGADDNLGDVVHVLDAGERGLGLGTHTVRSVRENGRGAGDFTVTYEIRRVPLPDLKPVNIKVSDLPGRAEKRVCMAVQNVEVVHAGPFEVALKLNNAPVPGGQYTVGLLASGTHVDACVDVALPTTGRYKLSAAVDEARRVTEFNEANNLYEVLHVPTGPSVAPTDTPAASGTPAPATNSGRPDLVVGAIKINGRTPDGKDDCKDGLNDIVVVVKNEGATRAGDFFVRLVVDDDRDGAPEQGMGHLDPGKEAPIKFEGVRLKKGQHGLEATADWRPGTGIAESDEANNARTVTVRCKDD